MRANPRRILGDCRKTISNNKLRTELVDKPASVGRSILVRCGKPLYNLRRNCTILPFVKNPAGLPNNAGVVCRRFPNLSTHQTIAMNASNTGPGTAGNVMAALASFFVPGLGQLVQGRPFVALIHFILAAVLWVALLGWLIHLWSILDAAWWRGR